MFSQMTLILEVCYEGRKKRLKSSGSETTLLFSLLEY